MLIRILFLTLFSLIVSLLIYFGVAAAHAAQEGHGGRAIVCRDAKGKIKSAEMLDLFEGRELFKFNIQKSNVPYVEQARRIAQKLHDAVPSDSKNWILHVSKNMKLINNNIVLAIVDDSLDIAAPKDCGVEQLANYLNDDSIFVSKEIWNALGETDKAALLVHEGLYRDERTSGATDSRRTRRLTAYAFSDQEFDLDVAPNDAIKCYVGEKNTPIDIHFRTRFYIYKDLTSSKGPTWSVQFTQLLGQFIYKKYIIPIQLVKSTEARNGKTYGSSYLVEANDSIFQAGFKFYLDAYNVTSDNETGLRYIQFKASIYSEFGSKEYFKEQPINCDKGFLEFSKEYN